MFGLGRSRAHKYEASAQRMTFADVAGIDEAKTSWRRSSTISSSRIVTAA